MLRPRRALDWEQVPDPEGLQGATALSLGLQFPRVKRWTPVKNNLTVSGPVQKAAPSCHTERNTHVSERKKGPPPSLCVPLTKGKKTYIFVSSRVELVVGYGTVVQLSPLHASELCPKSTFLSPVCLSFNQVSLGAN